jgi:hypothetical protein
MPQNIGSNKIDTRHLYENLTKFLGSCQLMNSAYVEKHFELVAVFSTLKSLYTRFKALNSITSQQIAKISELIDEARQNVSMDNMEDLEKQQNQIMFNTYKLYQNLSGTMYNLETNPGAYLTCEDSLQSVIISVIHSQDENKIASDPSIGEIWSLGDSIQVEGPESIFSHLTYPAESSKSTQEAKDLIQQNKKCLDDDARSLESMFNGPHVDEKYWKTKILDLWGELDLSSLYRIFAYVVDHLSQEEVFKIQNMIIYISLLQSYTFNPYLKVERTVTSLFHLKTPESSASQSETSGKTTTNLNTFVNTNYFHGRLSVYVTYDNQREAENDLKIFRDTFLSEGSILQTVDGKSTFQRVYFKSIKILTVENSSSGKTFYIIFELPLRYTVLNIDADFIAIPSNVKLKYSLEDVKNMLISISGISSQDFHWGLYVFEKYSKEKKFDGEVFDLGETLSYYLLSDKISIATNVTDINVSAVNEVVEVSFNASTSTVTGEVDKRNNIMSYLHHRIDVDSTGVDKSTLTKWIWYLSVMKARTFGNFMRFVDKTGIIEKIEKSKSTNAVVLSEEEEKVVEELSSAIANEPGLVSLLDGLPDLDPLTPVEQQEVVYKTIRALFNNPTFSSLLDSRV